MCWFEGDSLQEKHVDASEPDSHSMCIAKHACIAIQRYTWPHIFRNILPRFASVHLLSAAAFQRRKTWVSVQALRNILAAEPTAIFLNEARPRALRMGAVFFMCIQERKPHEGWPSFMKGAGRRDAGPAFFGPKSC